MTIPHDPAMPLRDIDVSLIRAFVAVAETGSISSAARRLYVTQSGLSLQIKRLERFFDCVLFARDARGSRMTERGIALLPHAQRLLALNDALCEVMRGPSIPERVRVGVPYDMAGAHFAPVLKAFAHRYPASDVILVGGSSIDLMALFKRGEVELTLSQRPIGADSDASGEHLAFDDLVWIGARDADPSVRPLPLCFVTPTCTFRNTVFQVLAEERIDWKVIFENASVDATLSTVRNALALTAWLRALLPDDLCEVPAIGGLPPLPTFEIALHVAPDAGAGAMAMAAMIREYYAEVTGSVGLPQGRTAHLRAPDGPADAVPIMRNVSTESR